MRRIGRDYLAHLGTVKQISSFLATRFAILGWNSESAPPNQPLVPSDANRREPSRGNGERFLVPGYGCLPRADLLRRPSQRSPFLVQRRPRLMVVLENQRAYGHRRGVFSAFFRRPGADQASAPSDSLQYTTLFGALGVRKIVYVARSYGGSSVT